MSTALSSDPCAAVRHSCASFQSDVARVDEVALLKFASNIDISTVKKFCFSGDGLSTNRFEEIPFPSASAEAGFIFIAHALDFGSGFRPLLHEHRGGQGAWLTIRAGLVNLGLVNPSMTSSWLTSLSLVDVKHHFDLTVPELEPLARYLFEDIQEIGQKLIQEGFETPGDFIMHHVSGGASALVALFVQKFPLCFCDEYIVRGQTVYFYKKAQLVVSELYMRFANEVDGFNFKDVDNLTAFVDNVVVAMMRLHGIVKANSQVDSVISSGMPIVKGSEEEVVLRSSSLHAIEVIVSKLKCQLAAADGSVDLSGLTDAERLRAAWSVSSPHINAQMLCNWLWGCVGKEGENRNYPRHLTPSTSYY